MGKIIGIDLGTTNSVVSVMEAGEPIVIVNEEGNRTTPSIVGFAKDGEVLVGQVAKRQAITNPENTIFSAKRFIGRRFDEVQSEMKYVPYKISSEGGDVRINAGDKKYAPPEISAKILQKLKAAAETYLGESVTEAVITVPAYFNDSQRQATKDAGKIAGLDVKRIINEPTAAALAYGLDKKEDEVIVVYDFGGGTFDVSVLEVGDNVIEVKSTNGDTHLGGDDIDHAIIDWIIAEFKKDSGIDLSSDKMVLQRLRDAAEKAKIELSSTQSTNINLPFITADASGPKHLELDLKRAQFERMIEKLIERTLGPCKTALNDAGVKPADVNEVVLVGGSTRIPAVIEAVTKFFGKEPHRGVNPDEVVAIGAAIQGGVLAGDVQDVVLLDVTPLSLGIETLGGVMTKLIEKNTTIPASRNEIFSTAADNQTSVEIHVLQGEREMATHNRTLGKFRLDGIPPAPRGIPQVEVTFDIDANGILKVSAKDTASGKVQNITITASSGISEDEIQRMVKDAEEHAEEDRKRKEVIETRNQLDSLIYSVEKSMSEAGDKLSESDKAPIAEAIAKGKSALEGEDAEAMKSATDAITHASHKLAEIMYQNASAESAGAQAGATPDEDVIDAEYEESGGES